MRACFREQLRRRKGRYVTRHPFWRNAGGVRIPWTVGQRKWMALKVSAAMDDMFQQRVYFTERASKPLIVSSDFFEAYQQATKNGAPS